MPNSAPIQKNISSITSRIRVLNEDTQKIISTLERQNRALQDADRALAQSAGSPSSAVKAEHRAKLQDEYDRLAGLANTLPVTMNALHKDAAQLERAIVYLQKQNIDLKADNAKLKAELQETRSAPKAPPAAKRNRLSSI